LPCGIGFVALKIGKDTDTTILGCFGVEVSVSPGGALHASTIKQAVLALVINLTKSHWGLDFIKTALDMRLVRRIDGFPFESSEWEGEMTKPIRRVTVCPAHD
jgi:hypothetical protein